MSCFLVWKGYTIDWRLQNIEISFRGLSYSIISCHTDIVNETAQWKISIQWNRPHERVIRIIVCRGFRSLFGFTSTAFGRREVLGQLTFGKAFGSSIPVGILALIKPIMMDHQSDAKPKHVNVTAAKMGQIAIQNSRSYRSPLLVSLIVDCHHACIQLFVDIII